MTDAKIRVGLDVPAIQADLDKVRDAAKRVTDDLRFGSVGIDTDKDKKALDNLLQDAERLADVLGDLTDKEILDPDALGEGIKALEKAAQAAGRLDKAINGGKGTNQNFGLRRVTEEYRALERQLRQNAKAHQDAAREGDTADEREAEKARQRVEAQSEREKQARQLAADEARRRPWQTARDAVLGEVLPGGAGGRIMHRAVTDAAAMEGGLFSGQGLALMGRGALLGGAAYGVVKAVQGVRQHMDSATGEAIALSDLRHLLGPLNHDFEELRVRVRDLTDDFGLSADESVKLAREMAHVSGVVDEDVRTASRFARDYGMEPTTAGKFFSEMRHIGASRNETDNRRLALMIGEAVNRDGLRHRADELLEEVAGLAISTARASLTTPHAESYVDAVSALAGSGLPGLAGDPAMAGRLLALVDESIRHGGMAGEASKSFTLGAFQREIPGFNAFDLGPIQAGGAFTTPHDAFGPKSPTYRLAETMGDTRAMRHYETMWNDETPTLSRLIKNLERESGGSADRLRLDVAGYTGLPEPLAAALATTFLKPGGFDHLQKSMQDSGLDPENLKQAGAYAEMLFDPKAAARLWEHIKGTKGVPEADTSKVSAMIEANGGQIGEDAIKAMAALANRLGLFEDEGSRARQAQINLDRVFQSFAGEAIPLLTTIKTGIVELVRPLSNTFESARRLVEREDAAVAGKAINSELSDLAGTRFSGKTGAGGMLNDVSTRRTKSAVEALTQPGLSPTQRRQYVEFMRDSYKRHPELYAEEFPAIIDRVERSIGTPSAPPAEEPIPAALPPKHRAALDERSIPANTGDVVNELKRFGWSDAQAAGIVGNLIQESSLRPNAEFDGNYGIAQWRSGRLRELKGWAGRNGLDYRDWRAQIGFLDWELGHTERPAGDAIRAAETPGEAAVAMFGYERAAGYSPDNPMGMHASGRRIGNAERVYRDIHADGFNDKIPSSRRHQGAQAMEFSHQHQHTITVLDRAGNPIPAPVTTFSTTGAPTPAGTAR